MECNFSNGIAMTVPCRSHWAHSPPGAALGARRAPVHEQLTGRVEVFGGVPSASASYGVRHMPFP
eukprot:9248446-Prorocentrum_lima.AAC.1